MKNKVQLVFTLFGCLTVSVANHLTFGAGSFGERLENPELAWSIVPSPHRAGVKLYGVSASSLTQAWAVGDIYSPLTPIIYRWNGTAWRQVSSGAVPDSSLRDVAAISDNDVWAIGYKFSFNNGYQGLAMHWNGARWSEVPVPVTGDSYTLLNGITALSPSDVWTVGNGGVNPIKALTAHWDGNAWTYVPNPSIQSDYAFLNGVTALSPDNVWTVGYFTDGAGVDHNLVEHWDGVAWAKIDVPETRQAHNDLWGITPDPVGGVWAVGSFLATDFSKPLSSLVLHGSP